MAALVPLALTLPASFDRREERAGAAVVDPRTVGTNDHWFLFESDADLDADMDAMVAAGVTWLRVSLDWPSVQPKGPTTWNWAHEDRVVREANERGIKILFLAAYSPAWARPVGSTSLHTPPVNPDHFANFVREAAKRYGPQGVHHYEIWNEPNLGQWWQPAANPAQYAVLLKKASSALKGVDPAAYVVTGGLAPGSDNATDRSMKTFIEQLYVNGAQASFDAVGIHPYSFPWSPQFAAGWNPFFSAPKYHDILRSRGDGSKPLWATEVAFPTGTGSNRVSEATQADMLEALVVGWDNYSFGGPLFWHNIRDRGADLVDLESNWGLLRFDRSKKPAFTRLQQLLRSAQDVDANPGPQSVAVRWNAPANPTSPIMGWRVVASPGNGSGNGSGNVAGTVTIDVGAEARTATVPLIDFTTYTVTVQPLHASGAGVVSKPTRAVMPGAPVIIPTMAEIAEQNTGQASTLQVPVVLSGVPTRDVSINYSTVYWAPAFTAHIPNDYTPVSGTLTIPAGQTIGYVRITVRGDNYPEPKGDLILVTFANPSNGTLGGFQVGVGRILGDKD
jgi:hypothetical protein